MTSVVAPEIDLEITQGSDWSWTFGWGSSVLVWKGITAITRATPCVITAAAHGLVDGWPFWVEGVGGMREINRPIAESETNPYFAKVQDASNVVINDLSSAAFRAYTSGGAIGYYSPISLSGYTARMQFRSSPSQADPPLISLTSPAGIVIDDTAKTIKPVLTAAQTAAITWLTAQYDLEAVSAGGIVTPLARGTARITREITK